MTGSPQARPASTAVSLARRFGLPLYWLGFAAYTLLAARHPGLVRSRAPRPYPWEGVLDTWGVLAGATAILHAILRPRTFRRSWGRLLGALVYAGGLTLLAVVTYATDMPGSVYVPGRYAAVTVLGLVVLAIVLRTVPKRSAADPARRAPGVLA